jgi:YD repeat-containing protein
MLSVQESIAFMKPLFRYTALLMLVFGTLLSQQSDFIPKSKKAIEREKQTEQTERKRIVSSGIQTVSQTKFLFKFGKVNPTGTMESFVRYDGKGNIIRRVTYSPSDGKAADVTTYQYDKNGNLLEELYKKEENTLKTVHRYNALNNRVETVSYNAQGAVEKKVTFIYDETGLLLETFGRLDDGKIFMRDSYLYDGRGNVVEYRNNLRKFVMTYDRAGNMSSVVKYQRYFKSYDSVQYVVNERFTFDYDRYDNLIELRSYRTDSTLKSRTQYIVAESGKILSEKEYGSDGRLLYTKNLKYDKNMNLLEETGSDRALKFRNVFKYDARGNRTEWTAYDQINEPVSVIKYSYGKNSGSAPASSPGAPIEDDGMLAEDGEGGNNSEFFDLLGSRIIAPDGTYLGMVVADTANPQSIINTWGQYGFTQSPTSIFNQTVPYGGESGIFSPFNAQSPSPPSVFKDGKFFAYLTDNDSFRPRSAPRRLIEFLKTLSRQN